MSAPDLLPCPLCGGEPVMIPRVVMYPDWFQCVIMHDGGDGHLVRVIATGDTAPEAIEAASAMWNRRNERTCHAIPNEPRWAACECSACGGELESFNKFCPNCGARVMKE